MKARRIVEALLDPDDPQDFLARMPDITYKLVATTPEGFGGGDKYFGYFDTLSEVLRKAIAARAPEYYNDVEVHELHRDQHDQLRLQRRLFVTSNYEIVDEHGEVVYIYDD